MKQKKILADARALEEAFYTKGTLDCSSSCGRRSNVRRSVRWFRLKMTHFLTGYRAGH